MKKLVSITLSFAIIAMILSTTAIVSFAESTSGLFNDDEYGFEMEAGASIRLNEQKGLRFYTKISTATANKINELEESGATVEMGTLIVPTSVTNGAHSYKIDDVQNLTLDTEEKLDVVYHKTGADNYTSHYFIENGQTYCVGSIVEIKDINVTRNFIGRGYIKVTYGNGDVDISYASVEASNARSVAYVAYKMYESGNEVEKYNAFKKYVDDLKEHIATNQAELRNAIWAGGICMLLDDIEYDLSGSIYSDASDNLDVIIDMNGHTLTWADSAGTYLFKSQSGTMTITGNGTVVSNKSHGPIFTAISTGNLVIKDGTFIYEDNTKDYEMVYQYSENNTIEIYGGTFWNKDETTLSSLNVRDAVGADNVNIIIYGGTFINFSDPANGDRRLGGTYVAEGYESVKTGENTYEVRKISD